ncbi:MULTISPECIES: hypothetical protein [Roseomonadaceae]|uniref:Uncharacterized protein n=1 Tax=Falsiroseomonas oleicola TaxID=2801474 RepID=A0ABS6H838_9PROT|nr:hypothetical protein [Roseomonas oleicola]MBU8543972.1 hypothetical protein [Roseomonas oleicola]
MPDLTRTLARLTMLLHHLPQVPPPYHADALLISAEAIEQLAAALPPEHRPSRAWGQTLAQQLRQVAETCQRLAPQVADAPYPAQATARLLARDLPAPRGIWPSPR